jgi:hypothetical protein
MFHISYILPYTCHYFFIISPSGAFDYRICHYLALRAAIDTARAAYNTAFDAYVKADARSAAAIKDFSLISSPLAFAVARSAEDRAKNAQAACNAAHAAVLAAQAAFDTARTKLVHVDSNTHS